MDTKREHLYCNEDNSSTVKIDYPEQWEVFEPFAKKYPDLCLQFDGIADKKWKNEKVKILFLLKDSYRYEDKRVFLDRYVMDDVLKKDFIPKDRTWKRIYDWNNAIRISLGLGEVADLKNIAFMNLSKIACDERISKNTRPNTLAYAITEDKEELLNQYNKINPNIVVCGNTGSYLFKLLGYDLEKIQEGTIFKGKIRNRNRLFLYRIDGVWIFDAYHPSWGGTSAQDFVEVINKNTKKFNLDSLKYN